MKCTTAITTFASIGSILMVGACTTTLVSYRMADQDADPPTHMFPYALPRTRLATTFTVTLGPCKVLPNSKYPSLSLKVSAASTQSFEADPDARYYIDYRELETFTKSTNLKVVTASDQTLQSVNAETNDQTLQVAGAFLQTAASVAGAFVTGGIRVPSVQSGSAPLGNPDEPAPKANPVTACSKEATDALQKLSHAQTQLQQAQANAKAANPASDSAVTNAANDVVAAQKAVTMTIPVTVMPSLDDFPAGDDGKRPLLATYSLNIVEYVKPKWVSKDLQSGWMSVSINGSDAATEASSENLAAKAALARVRSAVAAETAAASAAAAAPADSAKAKAATDAAASAAVAKSAAPALSDVSLELYVMPTSMSAKSVPDVPKPASGADRARVDGFVVRQPAIGFLRACSGQCMRPDRFGVVPLTANGTNVDLGPQARVSVPQLGKTLTLPLQNKIGQDMSLAVAVAPDGGLTTLSFQDNSTIAGGLTAVGNAGTAYTAAITSENAAITSQNTAVSAAAALATSTAQYPDNVLKAQADCIQQQAAIVKANGTPMIHCQ